MGERHARLEKNRLIPFPSDDLGLLKETPKNAPQEQLLSDLAENGYLFIRGCINRETVLSAKRAVLDYMTRLESEQKIFSDNVKGILDNQCGRHCVPMMEGKNNITHNENVLAVLENEDLFGIFERIFGSPAKSFDFKWLRAMYMEGFTGAHVDSVYMSKGSPRTLTCWLPFDDVPVEIGGLAICEGSNCLESFKPLLTTYGEIDLDALNFQGSGWFTEDSAEITKRFGGQWVTADFQAGDALIFTLKTVHMSLTNQTHYARISCDTRWYPAHERPDPRFVGEIKPITTKYGDNATVKTDAVTIDDLKEGWGFISA